MLWHIFIQRRNFFFFFFVFPDLHSLFESGRFTFLYINVFITLLASVNIFVNIVFQIFFACAGIVDGGTVTEDVVHRGLEIVIFQYGSFYRNKVCIFSQKTLSQ